MRKANCHLFLFLFFFLVSLMPKVSTKIANLRFNGISNLNFSN